MDRELKKERIGMLKNIPQEIKALKNWVVWRLEPNKNNPNKLDKIPYNSRSKKAAANNPNTWITYEEAEDLFMKYDFDGVGMEIDINDEYFYIDVDGIIPQDILNSFDSYIEISQSGKGAHIIAKCDKELLIQALGGKEGRKNETYEIYAGGRFLAITGNIVSPSDDINYCTKEGIDFYNNNIKKQTSNQSNTVPLIPSPSLTDDEILEKARRAKNSQKFQDLWDGNLGNKNEQDCALIGILAFYTQDEEQLLRLWKQSGLYRTKTDRKDYAVGVIAFVLNGLTETWNPQNNMTKQMITTETYVDGGYEVTEIKPIFDTKYCIRHEKVDKKELTKTITYTPELCSENIAVLLDFFDIELKYNLLSKDIEINGFEVSIEQEHMKIFNLTDFIHNKVVFFKFNKDNFNMIERMLKSVARKNCYNPVVDYLNSLTPLAGEKNLRMLADTLVTPAYFDDNFKLDLLRTWLISCIRAGYTHNGFKSEGILIMQGEQGLKKTTWFEFLFSMCESFFKDGLNLDPDNKDSVILITKYWCVELGELASTFKKDLNKLKAFISSSVDEYRAPYDSSPLKYPRRTIMCGTVNDEFFLKDETGNRRYWIIPVIDLKPTYNIDINAVWAEILYIYKNTDPQKEQKMTGNDEPAGRWWISKRENEKLGQYQQAHEIQQEWESFLEAALKIGQPATTEYTALDIYKKIGANHNISTTQIGKFLSRRKIQKRVGAGNKAYYKLPKIEEWTLFGIDTDDDIDTHQISNIPNIPSTPNLIPDALKDNKEIKNIFRNDIL